MTVRELIILLRDCPSGASVKVSINDGDSVSAVDVDDNDDVDDSVCILGIKRSP